VVGKGKFLAQNFQKVGMLFILEKPLASPREEMIASNAVIMDPVAKFKSKNRTGDFFMFPVLNTKHSFFVTFLNCCYIGIIAEKPWCVAKYCRTKSQIRQAMFVKAKE